MGDLDLGEVLNPPDLGFTLGPVDMVTAVVDGRVVLYALSRVDATVTAFELTDTGFAILGSLALQGAWLPGIAPALSICDDGILVEGLEGDPLVTLAADGAPLAQSSFGDLAAPQNASVFGDGLLVSVGEDGDGFDLFTPDGGVPTLVGTFDDGEETYLRNISAIHSFRHGGEDWLALASADEDGLTLFKRDPSGDPVFAMTIGVPDGLFINEPVALASTSVGADTYLLVASRISSSISVLRLTAENQTEVTDHILDSASNWFADASSLAVAEYDGVTFVAVAGSEGGVTLLTLLPNGRLQRLHDIADSGDTTLYRPSDLTLTVLGSVLHLSVSSIMDQGVTRLTLDLSSLGQVITAPLGGASLIGTADDDRLVGSDVADTLDGGAGDDILFDGSGSDLMKGGLGADLFVFAADGLPDTVLGFEPGVDRLDLSSFAFLHDVSQLQITPTAEGASLFYNDEVVHIVTAESTPLPSGALSTADILDLDRPILTTQGQNLKGGDGDDTIIGGSSGDTIQGGGGEDAISGAPGDDMLIGQGGADTITGGTGDDSLIGDAGDDAIRGDDGADWISGGDGGDLLLGDGAEDWNEPFDWGGV